LKLPEYRGIKEGYPRVRRRFGKLADYIALTRPFTLIAPITVGLLLTLAAEGFTFQALTKGVYVGITLALAQACGQAMNQAMDADIDRLAKPYRPVASGRVTRDEAMGLAFLLALAAVGRGFTISVYFGLMVCLMLFFAAFYSLPPFSPRRLSAWLNLLWISFSRSFLPFIAVMGLKGFPYAILAFAWALGWQGTKDIPDVEADRRFGIKTIANTCGVEGLRAYSFVLTMAYGALALMLCRPLFLLLLPLAAYGLMRYDRPWRGENTIAWAVYYSGLGLMPLLVVLERLLQVF
jgi:geranylgeranylglycerol-phosphate geranylgeranyltransferase